MGQLLELKCLSNFWWMIKSSKSWKKWYCILKSWGYTLEISLLHCQMENITYSGYCSGLFFKLCVGKGHSLFRMMLVESRCGCTHHNIELRLKLDVDFQYFQTFVFQFWLVTKPINFHKPSGNTLSEHITPSLVTELTPLKPQTHLPCSSLIVMWVAAWSELHLQLYPSHMEYGVRPDTINKQKGVGLASNVWPAVTNPFPGSRTVLKLFHHQHSRQRDLCPLSAPLPLTAYGLIQTDWHRQTNCWLAYCPWVHCDGT